MTQVWRINIKTASQQKIDPRKFAIDKGYLGIGWPVAENPTDWETYKAHATELYKKRGDRGWWPAINAIKNRMNINDLCWTRDKKGVYYIGRIIGAWEYKDENEFIEADLVNVRACDWVKIGTVDAIPGKVVNSFIPSRTVQRVNSKTILEFSKHLYNSYSTDYKYQLDKDETDLYALLSSDDCEDVIGIYLQSQYDYMLVPSSCKSDTMFYEYVLIDKETFCPATVQVKNGFVDLKIDDYINDEQHDVFLFTTRGRYKGSTYDYIHCLDPEKIKAFICSNYNLMPKKVQTWIDYIN